MDTGRMLSEERETPNDGSTVTVQQHQFLFKSGREFPHTIPLELLQLRTAFKFLLRKPTSAPM